MKLLERIWKIMQEKPLSCVLILSLSIRIVYLLFNFPLWWDSHIYLAIGKYIFSHGQMGIWEAFRPPLHPLLLGFGWKIGIPPLLFGKILDLILSMITIFLLFRIAEKIYTKDVAVLSALLFALTPVYLLQTGLMLSDFLGLTFALMAFLIYCKSQKEPSQNTKDVTRIVPRFVPGIWQGIFLGLAFLTRFPLGIWFGVIAVTIVCYNKMKEKAPLFFATAAGFFLVVTPYLLFNYYRYQDILYPFQSGSWIVTTATWLYGQGITYYFTAFFLKNPLYLFFFLYLYFYWREKEWKDQSKTTLVAIIIVSLLYFTVAVPRKETRYLISMIPLLAIAVSAACLRLYQMWKTSQRPLIRPKAFLIVIMLLIVLPLPQAFLIEQTPDFQREITAAVGNSTSMILTSNPALISWLDQPVQTLDGLAFAPLMYEQQRGKYHFLFIDTCDFSCHPEDVSCLEKQKNFVQLIQNENREIFRKTYIIKSKKQLCTAALYTPHD